MWNKGLATKHPISRTTRSGRCRCAAYTILGLILLLTGCSVSEPVGRTKFSSPTPAGFSATNTPVRTPDSSRQAEPSVPENAPPPRPADPGAIEFVQRIAHALEAEQIRTDQTIRISTRSLRNQSRAQLDEFDAMVQRLAALLDQAGREHRITFTADAAQPVDYHLAGTAYLVTTDGFDQWELYLSIRPADRAWTLWQSDAPVRLLRSPRLRSQQLFLLDSR